MDRFIALENIDLKQNLDALAKPKGIGAEIRALPLREYFDIALLPVLIQGLKLVAIERPDNAIEDWVVGEMNLIFQEASLETNQHSKSVSKTLRALTTPTEIPAFLACLLHVFQAKKDVSNLSTIFQFLNLFFTALASNRSLDIFQKTLVDFFLEGMLASNKVVRLRACQVLLMYMNAIEEMGEKLLAKVTRRVLDRMEDKDQAVRVQSALVLCRLQVLTDLTIQGCGSEEENKEVTKTLCTLLRHDPKPEIRRNIVTNLGIEADTVLMLLERARDLDVTVRRELYRRLSTEESIMSMIEASDLFDFLQVGLKERDAAAKENFLELVYQVWLPDLDVLFHLLNQVSDQVPQALDELLSGFFKAHSDVTLSSDDIDWANITPSGAMFVRSYSQYYSTDEAQERIEELIPSLTFWTKLMLKYVMKCEQNGTDGVTEFLLLQMLQTAELLDTSDEAGRRKLLILLRGILVDTVLSSEIMACTVKVLLKVHSNFNSFLELMAEIIGEIASNQDGDGPEATVCQFKCLEILTSVLQACNESQGPIMPLMETLVFPAISSEIQVIQQAGLRCLALCSLNDINFGNVNMKLFVNRILKGKDTDLCLKFLFDWISTYKLDSIPDTERVLEAIFNSLDSDDEKTATLAVEGVAKCLLMDKIGGNEILLPMILLYFLPQAAPMIDIRQCLSFFFNAYPKTTQAHQRTLKDSFFKVMLSLESLNVNNGKETVSLTRIAQQLMDWTDERELVEYSIFDIRQPEKVEFFHIAIATEGLELAVDESAAFKKAICQMLAKVYLSENEDDIQGLKTNAAALQACKLDLVASRALDKFIARLEDCGCAVAKMSRSLENLSV